MEAMMRHRIASLLFVVLVVLVLPHLSSAQTPLAESDAWRALAAALEPGAFISVRLTDGQRLTGTLVRATADGILLKPKTRLPVPARELSFADVESIERAKQGMKPGVKVLLGAGIGVGALMLVVGLLYAALGSS
jgi:hypothetical protein